MFLSQARIRVPFPLAAVAIVERVPVIMGLLFFFLSLGTDIFFSIGGDASHQVKTCSLCSWDRFWDLESSAGNSMNRMEADLVDLTGQGLPKEGYPHLVRGIIFCQ